VRSRALAVCWPYVVLIISIASVHAAQGGAGAGATGWGSRGHMNGHSSHHLTWMLLVGRCRRGGGRLRVRCALTYPYWAYPYYGYPYYAFRTLLRKHRSRRSCINSSPSPRSRPDSSPGGLSTDDGPARGRVPAWKVRAPRRGVNATWQWVWVPAAVSTPAVPRFHRARGRAAPSVSSSQLDPCLGPQ